MILTRPAIKPAEEIGVHAYASREELLSDPAIDLVTVAIPNDVHHEVCVDAMRHGKHVVCEKPVTLSSESLQEMIDESKRNHVIFTVHQNRRWDEDFLIMKKIYDEGTLGPVFNIESRVHGSRGIPGDWRNTKEHGGGMVLDWGIHLLDQIMQMIQKPLLRVYANLTYVTNENVDDGFKVILGFEDDLNVQVEVGTSNFINLPVGTCRVRTAPPIRDWDCSGRNRDGVRLGKRDAVPIDTAAGNQDHGSPARRNYQKYPLPRWNPHVRVFIANLVKVSRGEAEQLIRHDEMMRDMKLMEAIFRSDETHSVVTDIF